METPPDREDVEIPALVEAPVHADATAEAAAPGDSGAADEPVMLESFEIDLSTALADIGASPPPPSSSRGGGGSGEPNAGRLSEPPAPSEPVVPPESKNLEEIFDDIRARVSQDSAQVSEQYERAMADLRDGRGAEAVKGLEAVAREPAFRFQAAARLGWIYIERGDARTGIEWLERAAEAPAPTLDEGLAVLYKLADALERTGETARALAILIELDADTPGYRDVRERIDRLVRMQTGAPPSDGPGRVERGGGGEV
jgi:tetratricopeptide (TPR) repeat protein